MTKIFEVTVLEAKQGADGSHQGLEKQVPKDNIKYALNVKSPS